jgi:hypothetical protein
MKQETQMFARRQRLLILILTLTIGAQWPIAHAEPPKSGVAADYLKALLRFEPWAESVWKDYPKIEGAGYFGDGASDGNGGIRGSSGIALAYAVFVREFPDSPERNRRLARVEAALRYSSQTHSSGPADAVCVDGKKWGVHPGLDKHNAHGWQSPLWAGSMGFAAALLEKELSPQVIESCKRVVAAEADVLVKIPPASGWRLDSKCEENGWDSPITMLAASWMPNDPRAKDWLVTAKKYLANTYTVPDTSNDPLKAWVTTQTLFPSFAVENHGYYHPMYQVDGASSMGEGYLMTATLNPAVAKELKPFAEHNVIPTWRVVEGTILDSGDMAFPSGLDWSLHAFEHSNYYSYLGTHFNEPLAQWAEQRLVKSILARQAVNGDGRIIGDSLKDGFYHEAVDARSFALSYLHHQLHGFPNDPGAPPKEHITHYDDIGLIIQRTKNAMFTISYGTRTLSLVYPLNGKTLGQQFITSPNNSSMIGRNRGGDKTTLKSFKKTAEGFRAELALNFAAGRKSTMIIQSVGDAIAYLEIPGEQYRVRNGDWYLMAIENHPFTGGQRNILSEANAETIKERSGGSRTISTLWVNIDNWLGFAASSEGTMRYEVAKEYNRNGAAEDSVIFRPKDAKAPRAVVILPGGNATETAAVQKSFKSIGSSESPSFSAELPSGQRLKISAKE